jgi:hypothetical protein
VAWGAKERGMGAGCGAPTQEKAVAAGEGDLQASGAVDAPVTVTCVVRKGNAVVFSRNRETLKGGAKQACWARWLRRPKKGCPDGYAWTDALTREFPIFHGHDR